MDDIIYVKTVERKIMIKTESDYIEGSLTEQLDEILSRFGFARLNQNKIINLSKIKSVDYKLWIVYFDDEKLDYCLVSKSNRHKVLAYFDKLQQN